MEKVDMSGLRGWVDAWRAASPLLDEVKRREAGQVDLVATILEMTQAFRAALKACPPAATSGLVEQQRWLAGWRCKT